MQDYNMKKIHESLLSDNNNINCTSNVVNEEFDTLYEPISVSIKREFLMIYNKTQYAIIPRFSADKEKNLRQWDLWGPLFFTILLS